MSKIGLVKVESTIIRVLATPETSGRLGTRTTVQRFDFWDRLGELWLVHGFQGNYQRIVARENYPNDPRYPSVER